MSSTTVRRNSSNSLEMSSTTCLSDYPITSMQLMQTPKVTLTEEVRQKLDGAKAMFNGSTDRTVDLRELDSSSKQLIFNTGSDKIKAIRLLGSIIKEYQDKYKDLIVRCARSTGTEQAKLAEESKYCEDVCIYVWDAIGDMIFLKEPGLNPLFDSPVPFIQEMKNFAPSEAFIARAYIRCMSREIPDSSIHDYVSKELWWYALPETKEIYHNILSYYEVKSRNNPFLDDDIKGIKIGLDLLCEELEEVNEPRVNLNQLAII